MPLLAEPPAVDTGNTAWLLVSTALVLLMTPGLAMFYGGLNRAKGVLNMMMMSFSCIGLISVLWLLYGFSLAFGANSSAGANNVIGSFTQYLGNKTFVSEVWGVADGAPNGVGIPTYVFLAFQMMFAVITVALISGAISDRAKFAGWLLFAFGWFTIVYVPVAHWVWGGGFIGAKLHALDFAGGTAVHINAGAAALALALVLGRRIGWPKEKFRPHNVPMVALGAGLLWFGWFGFNAGSEITTDSIAGLAFINTQVATAAAVLGWLFVERVRYGKPTMVGASSGAVAGLVAITPACGFISPLASVALGLTAGAACALAVSLKYRFGFDDSLDVVGVHFVGGWIGSLWIGLFASAGVNPNLVSANGASEGLFFGGGLTQFGRQAVASGIVTVFSFAVAYGLAVVIEKTIGFRASAESEIDGIDITEHAEAGYDLAAAAGGGSGGSSGALAMAGIVPSTGTPARTLVRTSIGAATEPPAGAAAETSGAEGSVAKRVAG